MPPKGKIKRPSKRSNGQAKPKKKPDPQPKTKAQKRKTEDMMGQRGTLLRMNAKENLEEQLDKFEMAKWPVWTL